MKKMVFASLICTLKRDFEGAILILEPHRHNLSSYVASHPCQYGDDTSGISLKICNKKITFAQLISRVSTYRAASKVDFFLL